MLNKNDTLRLRELAKRQLELAESESNRQLYRDWEVHGRTDATGRPMITVEFGTFSDEFIIPMLQCVTEEARSLEYQLLQGIFQAEHPLPSHSCQIFRTLHGLSSVSLLLPRKTRACQA